MDTWILVIDDDAGTREALADILGRAGYGVLAWAGDAPFEAARLTRSFQAALVDYHLPFGNGLEVAARLKHRQPDCRVILTSSEPPPTLEEPPALGVVDHFLPKPFSKEVLLGVVERLCQPRHP